MSSESGGVVEAVLKTSAPAALAGHLGGHRRIHGSPAANQARQALFAYFSVSSLSEARRRSSALMSSERGGVVEAASSAWAALLGYLGSRRRIHGNPGAKQSRQVLFACFSASSSSEAKKKIPQIDEDGKRRHR